MKALQKTSRAALLGATAIAGAFSMSTLATAQDASAAADKDQKGQSSDIVVTGTLIKGIAPVGTNVVGVSQADIQALGAATAIDVLSTVPEISSAFNQLPAASTGISGNTTIRPSIRNIGAAGGSTTLLLLDGHNMVGAGILATVADADMIPAGALERVDVVPDGGSALYGSDALGGIINYITRRHMNGLEVDGHYGFADQYSKYDVNVTAGKDWGTGSILVSYAYRHNSDLLGGNRSYYRSNLTPFGGANGSSNNCNPGNVNVNGVNYALPGLGANTTNSCDLALYQDIYPEQTQNSVFVAFDQQLSDKISFDVTGYFTKRDETILAGPETSSGTITSTNPYFQPVAGATSETVLYNYGSANGNSVANPNNISEYGITPVLKYEIGHSWEATLMGNFGHSKTSTTSYELNSAAETAALAGTTTATALDPYNIAQTNASVLAGILGYAQQAQNIQELAQLRFNLSGNLVTLPGGDVKVDFGGQVSHEKSNSYQTDAVIGDLSNATFDNAGRSTQAIFGELFIPLVGRDNAKSFIHSLNVDVSGRYDHYSDFGGTFNPKIGVTFEPFAGFKIRGNYGTSFNAPSLADETGSIDSRAQVLSVSPFQAPGTPFFPTILRPTILLAGGGANLKPQTAHTFSVGGDYEPAAVPGLKLSLTYWNISIYDEISIYPFYTPGFFTNPAFSNAFVINPTLAQAQALIGNEHVQGPSLATLYSAGAVAAGLTPYAILNAERTNLGNEYIDGIDFNIAYHTKTNFGSLLALIGGTYTLGRESQAAGTTTRIDELSPNGGGQLAGSGPSRLQLSGTLGAQVHDLSFRVNMNYSSGFDIAPITTGAVTQTHVGSFHPVNLYAAYDFKSGGYLNGLTLSLNVDNVFNESPAYENLPGSYGVGNGATLGRLFVFGLKKKF